MSAFWKKRKFCLALASFGASLALFFLYMWLYTSVWGLALPKTAALRRSNARMATEAQVLCRDLDYLDEQLDMMKIRDEDIYRSIFGLSGVSDAVRGAGLRGDNRYAPIDSVDRTGLIGSLARKADMVTKKAYVQSRSYDDIGMMLRNAGDLSVSIPAICPVDLADSKVYISSPFGYRRHPVLGYSRMHRGMDFSMKPGQSVYATGDGVVCEIKVELRGYGRQVVLDHGFGYKTRYAHLKNILVTEGMKVKRGQQIATSGNSGLSSGPHLHYEVLYRGRNVNPYNYFDASLSEEQYAAMLVPLDEGAEEFYVHPSHRKK